MSWAYLENICYVRRFMFSRYLCQAFFINAKMTKMGIHESFKEASIGWKCFRLHKKDRDFHTLENECVPDSIRKTSIARKVLRFNR